jgi:hypothetical protein
VVVTGTDASTILKRLRKISRPLGREIVVDGGTATVRAND